MTTGDPYTAVLRAAAIIAAGMADVAVIASTNVKAARGGVFDGPTNVLLGEAGTEAVLPSRWTSMFQRMADREAQGGSYTTIHNRQRGPEIHMTVNNPIGATTRNAYRKVEKQLRPAKRSNDRAMLSTPKTTIGSNRARR